MKFSITPGNNKPNTQYALISVWYKNSILQASMFNLEKRAMKFAIKQYLKGRKEHTVLAIHACPSLQSSRVHVLQHQSSTESCRKDSSV